MEKSWAWQDIGGRLGMRQRLFDTTGFMVQKSMLILANYRLYSKHYDILHTLEQSVNLFNARVDVLLLVVKVDVVGIGPNHPLETLVLAI